MFPRVVKLKDMTNLFQMTTVTNIYREKKKVSNLKSHE